MSFKVLTMTAFFLTSLFLVSTVEARPKAHKAHKSAKVSHSKKALKHKKVSHNKKSIKKPHKMALKISAKDRQIASLLPPKRMKSDVSVNQELQYDDGKDSKSSPEAFRQSREPVKTFDMALPDDSANL